MADAEQTPINHETDDLSLPFRNDWADAEIERMREASNCDQLELARMKKRKLHLKDEIEQLADRITPDIIA